LLLLELLVIRVNKVLSIVILRLAIVKNQNSKMKTKKVMNPTLAEDLAKEIKVIHKVERNLVNDHYGK
jgi:hypothetical protein